MRRLILAVLAVAGACASAGAPPGGPEDHAPPVIVSASPDSGQKNAQVKSVEFRFNEVINDRVAAGSAGLGQFFLVSPRNGATLADWHRSRITVRPQRGFRENTAYRVTVLPGLSDLRGNVRRDTKTIMFSTGATFPQFSIPGRVFDWAAQRPAPNAYVEAALNSDTSVVYLAIADSSGQFDIGPLPVGRYTVRGLLDANSNRALDRNEKWDTVTVFVANTRQLVELDAIERDTVPAAIDAITPIDSVSIRVSFDKYLDPSLTLQPALVRIQRADSTELEVARVEWAAAFDRGKQARDSARRADSVAAARPPTAAPAQPTPTPAQPPVPVLTPGGGGARPTPPAPKPRLPAPERAIIVTLSPSGRLVPDATYRLTVRGMRNLLGRSREVNRTFTVPKPPPPPVVDTTRRRPPTDSTRRPPPATRPPR